MPGLAQAGDFTSFEGIREYIRASREIFTLIAALLSIASFWGYRGFKRRRSASKEVPELEKRGSPRSEQKEPNMDMVPLSAAALPEQEAATFKERKKLLKLQQKAIKKAGK